MKKSKMIKALLIEPKQSPRVIEIEASLASYQKQVGGLIEILHLDDDAVLVVNEEGKLLGLAPNRHYFGDVLVGNILILGSRGENLVGLSDAHIEKYAAQFAEPEEIDPDEVKMFIEAWFY